MTQTPADHVKPADAVSSLAAAATAVASARFFRAENCNRRILAGGLSFTFEPYEYFGGTWRGTYAASSQAEQAALASLCTDKASAVTEISQEEYARLNKKKAQAVLRNYTPLDTPPSRSSEALVAGSTAVVVENHGTVASEPLPCGKPVESLSAALTIGSVQANTTAKAALG